MTPDDPAADAPNRPTAPEGGPEPLKHPADEAEEPEVPQVQATGEALEKLIGDYLGIQSVPEAGRDDQWARSERDCRERINAEYWHRLFQRLAAVVAASPPDELVFGPGDDRLFDFGWADERLFPAGRLAGDQGSVDPQWTARGLRAHLAACDADVLAVPQRRRLAAALAEIRAEVEKLNAAASETTAARQAVESGFPAADQALLAEMNRLIDGTTVALAVLEAAKRSKGLAGEKMRDYARLKTACMDAAARRDGLLKRLGPPAHPAAEANRRLHELRMAIVARLQKADGVGKALSAAEAAAAERRTRRRAELELRLAEIREDIVMCGRWGRTTASPVLLQDRELNAAPETIEDIRRVEDYDPGLFANRKTELAGRPVVVLTPGIGNGSYDFRSNILIVPRTSPRRRLESVAFALALYRRDVDKSYGEERLWRSFLEDIPWAKLGGTPRSIQAQVRVFVRAYTTWATREAAGQPALPGEVREWFEARLAPSAREPIYPRSLRGLTVSRREELLALAVPEDLAGREGAEQMHLRGCLFWLKGDFQRAFGHFDRARELCPEFAPAWWALAACCRLGPEKFSMDVGAPKRLERALECLARFLDLAEQSWWTRKAQLVSAELQLRLEEMRRAAPPRPEAGG